jgi:hypothetical protein
MRSGCRHFCVGFLVGQVVTAVCKGIMLRQRCISVGDVVWHREELQHHHHSINAIDPARAAAPSIVLPG